MLAFTSVLLRREVALDLELIRVLWRYNFQLAQHIVDNEKYDIPCSLAAIAQSF